MPSQVPIEFNRPSVQQEASFDNTHNKKRRDYQNARRNVEAAYIVNNDLVIEDY